MKLLVRTATGEILAASNLGNWSVPSGMQIVDTFGDAETFAWPHNKGPTSSKWNGVTIVANGSIAEQIPLVSRGVVIQRLLDQGWGPLLQTAFNEEILMQLKWNSDDLEIPITHVDFRTFLSSKLGLNPDSVMWVGTQVVPLPHAPISGAPPGIGVGPAVDANLLTAPPTMPIQSAPLNWTRRIYDDFTAGTGIGSRWTAAYIHGARWLNDEIQYYVDPLGQPSIGYNPFSVVQEDGLSWLAITARQTPSADLAKVNGKPYQSGLVSNHLFNGNQTYGYYEVRVKFPNVRGIWPACWMLTSTAEWPPEIDGLEWPNNQTESAANQYFVNMFWGDAARPPTFRNSAGGWFTVNGNLLTGAYISWLWTPKFVAYYCNGVLFRQTNNPAFVVGGAEGVHIPMHIALNLAIGGAWATNPSGVGFPLSAKYTNFSQWNMT